MSRELGRLMSTSTQACCQVCLAQSPLSEACRRTLHDLPVVPGQLFEEGELHHAFNGVKMTTIKDPCSSISTTNSRAPRKGGHETSTVVSTAKWILFDLLHNSKKRWHRTAHSQPSYFNQFLEVVPFHKLCTTEVLQADQD